MPNKRNKNRKSITIHLSEERQNELNEYLNCQKNLKDWSKRSCHCLSGLFIKSYENEYLRY